MSTIRTVYHDAPPPFPATDQHPDAARYQVGSVWVDAIGGAPTEAELDAFVAPPSRWLVPKLALVDRLIAAGKMDAATAALNDPANATVKARWDACIEVWSDDPAAVALLSAIGADASAVLAAA
jgi:hypothetical protein